MAIIIPSKVTPLVLSYPDFTLGSIMNPDEFDQNNLDVQDKLNQFVETINALVNNTVELTTLVETTVQKFDQLIINTANSISVINDRTTIINNNLETHKTSTDHDTRYYNKTNSDFRYVLKTDVGTGSGVTVLSEVYTIVNADVGDGTFTYSDKDSNIITGQRDAQYQYFTLISGDYTVGSNRISAIVNDTLHRSPISGGMIELDSTHVGISSELSGAEITITYFSVSGSLGSGIVVGDTVPINQYYGKLWVDTGNSGGEPA